MSVRSWGEPTHAPVVLLHHLAADADDWAVVGEALAGDGRWVVAPDLRGHGSSGRTSGYSLELMRDDVVGLVDELGMDRFEVIGHSLGASVAVLVAEAVPHRVTRLVLEDAGPPTGSRRFPVPPDVAPEEMPFDWPMLVSLVGQLNDPDPRWWTDLGTIPSPVLVVAGGPGSANDQDELAAMAAAVQDGRLVTVAVGHHVHTTAPDEFLRVVRPFLTPSA